MKVFLFGIGGTGTRVLRSLTMLLAAGVKVPDDTTIIPIILDPDDMNEDTNRSLELIENYSDIYKELNLDKLNEKQSFFNTRLQKIKDTATDKNEESGIGKSFRMNFGNINCSFKDYIDYDNMNNIDKNFIDLLYDNSAPNNPKTELNFDLSVGFKGNPNLGSVVLHEIKDMPEFKQMQNVIGPGDKIFIISSIFGGTGASGFPSLVRAIRSSSSANLRNAQIGALVVKPYFSIAEESSSAINSKLFNSKTKAALSFYATSLYKDIEEVYYIADSPGEKSYDNKEGGESQKNNAHIVELIGASGIIEFLNKDSKSNDFFEFGIRKDDKTIHLGHFYEGFDTKIGIPLTKLAILLKIFNEDLEGLSNKLDILKELNFKKEMGESSFIKLKNFMKDVETWLNELSDNSRAFKPFTLKNDYENILSHKSVEKSFFGKVFNSKIGYDYIGKHVTNYIKESQGNGEKNTYKLFLNAMYKSADTIFNEKIETIPQIKEE